MTAVANRPGPRPSDPTRVHMLHMLREPTDPICVCDFTHVFALGQPTVSHHLAKLRQPGLVTAERDGVWTYYSLSAELSQEASALMIARQQCESPTSMRARGPVE